MAIDAAPNKRSYIRFSAIRCLLRGIPRQEVREIFRHSDRMVRLWVYHYNQGGVDALISKPIAGRKRKVSL